MSFLEGADFELGRKGTKGKPPVAVSDDFDTKNMFNPRLFTQPVGVPLKVFRHKPVERALVKLLRVGPPMQDAHFTWHKQHNDEMSHVQK